MVRRSGTQHPIIDEKDFRILQCLIHYPEATVDFISDKLGYSPSTVQKRLADLQAGNQRRFARVMEIRDWDAAGYPLRYRIDLKVDQIALRAGKDRGGPVNEPDEAEDPVGDEDGAPIHLPTPANKINSQKRLARYIKQQLAVLPTFKDGLLCIDVTILLGQEYDMSISLRARDAEVVLEFVTKGLRFLRGVHSTATSHESWSCADDLRMK